MSQFATQILPAQSKSDFECAVKRASAILRASNVAALPTETVYGLAANAWSAEAVRRIYAIKRRPPTNPLIVHIVGRAMLRQCVREWDETAERLAQRFWPGPLTLVVRRSTRIPDEVTAGGDTVAVRWPRHPLMQAVIRECGFPLAAPSANLSNQLSPTQARHVLAQLNGEVPLIVDSGDASVGIESTVVDLLSHPPKVLRPGMLHVNALRAAGLLVERKRWKEDSKPSIARSPGMAERHYSPKARLLVARWANQTVLEQIVRRTGRKQSAVSVLAHSAVPEMAGFARICLLSPNAAAYAQSLFAQLHACDNAGSEIILVQAPPEGAQWDGIWDRLKRASS